MVFFVHFPIMVRVFLLHVMYIQIKVKVKVSHNRPRSG